MEKIENVVIIGGGPAGANCALELAKNGISAIILDHSHPREKPCGGGISSKTIEEFPFVKKFSSKGIIPKKAMIISSPPQNQQFLVTGNQKRAFIISRQIFDEGILNIALKYGAKLIKERVIGLERDKQSCWKVITNKRSFKTKIVVGADGVTSLVRRTIVGKNMTNKEYARYYRQNLALTFGYFVSGNGCNIPTIRFLGKAPNSCKEYLPGYIWICPRIGHSSVGIGSELRFGGKLLKSLLDDFIKCYCPNIKRLSTFAWMLPSINDPNFFDKPCAGKDWLLVGDAAGHVDPIHGEGIYYALLSGKLAAEAIIRKELTSYDRNWRNAYGEKFKQDCLDKKWIYSPLGETISILKSRPSILETES